LSAVASLDEVARLAATLPEVVEGAGGHRGRTWSVRGKAFAWERAFSKADIRRFGDETPPDGPILAVRTEDLSEKEAVLAAGHTGVFTIPHFDGYAAVLLELGAIGKRACRELIVDGWLASAPRALAEAYVAKHPPH
jgi:hypothetical protein